MISKPSYFLYFIPPTPLVIINLGGVFVYTVLHICHTIVFYEQAFLFLVCICQGHIYIQTQRGIFLGGVSYKVKANLYKYWQVFVKSWQVFTKYSPSIGLKNTVQIILDYFIFTYQHTIPLAFPPIPPRPLDEPPGQHHP